MRQITAFYIGPIVHAAVVAILTLVVLPGMFTAPADGEGVDILGALVLAALTALGLPWCLPWNMFTPVSEGGANNSMAVLLVSTVGSALVNVALHVLLLRRRRARAAPPDPG